MEDNVSWLPHSNDRFCIWKHLLNHICVTRPQKPQIWWYIMVSFLNHLASVLSERVLTCEAVYPLCFQKKVQFCLLFKNNYMELVIKRRIKNVNRNYEIGKNNISCKGVTHRPLLPPPPLVTIKDTEVPEGTHSTMQSLTEDPDIKTCSGSACTG